MLWARNFSKSTLYEEHYLVQQKRDSHTLNPRHAKSLGRMRSLVPYSGIDPTWYPPSGSSSPAEVGEVGVGVDASTEECGQSLEVPGEDPLCSYTHSGPPGLEQSTAPFPVGKKGP